MLPLQEVAEKHVAFGVICDFVLRNDSKLDCCAELAETWMARGQGFLNAGDIGAARILFERLANAGIVDGAFAGQDL